MRGRRRSVTVFEGSKDSRDSNWVGDRSWQTHERCGQASSRPQHVSRARNGHAHDARSSRAVCMYRFMKSSRLSLYAAMTSAVLVTCVGRSSEDEPVPEAVSPTADQRGGARIPPFSPVILVTLDGVRWQDVFGAVDETLSFGDAKMPVLRALVRTRGAMIGAPVRGKSKPPDPTSSRCRATRKCSRGTPPVGRTTTARAPPHPPCSMIWPRVARASRSSDRGKKSCAP